MSAMVVRPAEVLCIPDTVLYQALEEFPKDYARVRRATVKLACIRGIVRERGCSEALRAG